VYVVVVVVCCVVLCAINCCVLCRFAVCVVRGHGYWVYVLCCVLCCVVLCCVRVVRGRGAWCVVVLMCGVVCGMWLGVVCCGCAAGKNVGKILHRAQGRKKHVAILPVC
jgi:hypothetical protein